MNTESSETNTSAMQDTELSAKEGSTLYYSLLFTDSAQSTRALQTLKLIDVISTTLNEVSEPQVAEKKIHWWHEELARMSNSEARHPACINVQSFLTDQDAINNCLSILSATANERYSPLATESDLRDMIIADYGARINLLEFAMRGKLPAYPHDAAALGLGQAHRLGSLAQRLQHGYIVFSDDQYAQYNLGPEQLVSNNEACAALLRAAVEQTDKTLLQAIEELSATKGTLSASLPIHTMTALRQLQTKLWLKQTPNLLNEYITVTPIRKFFAAYRCKRKFA